MIVSSHVGFISFNLSLQFPRVYCGKTGVEGKSTFLVKASLCWSQHLPSVYHNQEGGFDLVMKPVLGAKFFGVRRTEFY